VARVLHLLDELLARGCEFRADDAPIAWDVRRGTNSIDVEEPQVCAEGG
jgi:hypothetical protein